MNATIPKYRLFIVDNFWSLVGAGYLLLFDVLYGGSFLLSIVFCPIWLFVSLIRNGKTEWRLALFRIAMPVLILGIALANTFIQWKIADTNGERVVRACEAFHSDNGRYPKTLNELVPRYLPSVPRAKYSADGNFFYSNLELPDEPPGEPPKEAILWWNKIGLLRRMYSFERKEWRELD
jgi:hypothetical protein